MDHWYDGLVEAVVVFVATVIVVWGRETLKDWRSRKQSKRQRQETDPEEDGE